MSYLERSCTPDFAGDLSKGGYMKRRHVNICIQYTYIYAYMYIHDI